MYQIGFYRDGKFCFCFFMHPPSSPFGALAVLFGLDWTRTDLACNQKWPVRVFEDRDSMTCEKYDRCSTVMGKKDFTDGYIVPHFIDITLTLAVCFLL